MQAQTWKIVGFPLIIAGSISVVYSFIMMDPIRDIISAMILLLFGLLIILFRRENKYLAFFITGLFIGLKIIFEVIIIYPVIELYMWIDLVGFWITVIIGTLLFRRKND